MAVTLPPRPEDLINLSGNMSVLYPPGFFGASGSIITIIVLLVFTFILAIGNLVILVYLYKMANGLNDRAETSLKNMEKYVWDSRKFCNEMKAEMKKSATTAATPSPPNKTTNIEEGQVMGGDDGDDGLKNNTVNINSSRFLSSTPDRNSRSHSHSRSHHSKDVSHHNVVDDVEIISPISGQRSYGHTKPKVHSPERFPLTQLSSTVIPEVSSHRDQAMELMSNAIDQSFDRMLDKVDRNPNKTK